MKNIPVSASLVKLLKLNKQARLIKQNKLEVLHTSYSYYLTFHLYGQ